MTSLILALVFLALTLMSIVVRKTYYHLPVKELKRRAAKNNHDAQILYSAVAHKRSLRALLWIFIAIFGSITVVLISRINFWLGVITIGPILWVAFSYIPATKVGSFDMKLTVLVTPSILWILNYLHPTLSKRTEKLENKLKSHKHTKLFEKDDLIDLINKQLKQDDSRFTEEELEIAKRALNFSDYQLSDILIPESDTKSVLEMDHLGPVLIDEIYKTGQKYILVKDGKEGGFTGILEAGQLGLHSQGLVANIMRPTVYYLHEDDNLSDALKAFFVTNYPVFVVVNSQEEFIGIVTIDSVLRQLMGHVPGDEFSEYSDKTAVANRHNRTDLLEHELPEAKPAD